MPSAERLFRLLFFAYIFGTFFIGLFHFPVVMAKIQLPEMVFPFLFLAACQRYGWRLLHIPRAGLVLLGIYLLSNLFSAVWSKELSALLEALGRVYLAVLALIAAAFFREESDAHKQWAVRVWIAGAMALAGISLAAYLLALFGWVTPWVKVSDQYPYIGTVYRAAGVVLESGMLVVLMVFPFLILWQQVRLEKRARWVLVVLGATLLLTFSKELVLIAMVIALWEMRHKALAAGWRWMLALSSAAFFLFGTHVIVLYNQSWESSVLHEMPYSSGKEIFQIGPFHGIESTYATLKRVNIHLGLLHPWLGVGPGQSNQYQEEYRQTGQYPAHIQAYDPHSTWIGAFSETGAIGLIALLVLAIWIGKQSKLLKEPMIYASAIHLFLLFYLINSMSMDVMNHRNLWLVIGMLMGSISQTASLDSRG